MTAGESHTLSRYCFPVLCGGVLRQNRIFARVIVVCSDMRGVEGGVLDVME